MEKIPLYTFIILHFSIMCTKAITACPILPLTMAEKD